MVGTYVPCRDWIRKRQSGVFVSLVRFHMMAELTNSLAIMASGESSRWSTLSLEPRLV
jgi:hypothetical protein